MQSWLKAGLIAGGILAINSFGSFIPLVSCVCCILVPVIYVVAGALAAHFSPPPRDAGSSAGPGALAGVVAAAIGGIMSTLVAMIQTAVMGSEAALANVPPESIEQLQNAGIDPALIAGPAGVGMIWVGCCLVGIVLAAVLGAVGAAIYSAVRPNQ
jgi:hypothetical protein